MRDDWHVFWMKQAFLYAERATCDRRHVGCVLVRDNRLISAGYNGSLAKLEHCDEVGHWFIEGRAGCQRTSHAEANAIANAARMGHATANCHAYVTTLPCLTCFKLLHMAGIVKIYYSEEYRESHTQQLANAAGLPLILLTVDEYQDQSVPLDSRAKEPSQSRLGVQNKERET